MGGERSEGRIVEGIGMQSMVLRSVLASVIPRTSLASCTAARTEVPRSDLCSGKADVSF